MDAGSGESKSIKREQVPALINDQETQSFGDMSEFKKSVKGSENINARAAEREMPDARILDEVRESGVN